jgi:iron complex outermembrane recepter protein
LLTFSARIEISPFGKPDFAVQHVREDIMKSFGRIATATLLSGASIASLSIPAFAQDAEDDNSGFAEIVVTAQKREENLQQIPVAISAVSAEQLELRGLSEIKDLSAIAPNVSIIGGTTNATAAVVSIRGIPTPADETQGFDSPIGLYQDGVYLARSSAASFEVADIERVEVLRGPQGTLYGRNTTGGAINFITKKPDDEASLKVKLGAGNYGQKMGRFVINSGDIGGARMSLGYLRRQRDGIVDNLLEPKDSRDPGSSKVDSARWAVEIDVTDSISVYNVFDWTQISGQPHVQQLAEVGMGVFRPNVVFEGNTFSQVNPANVGGYLAQSTVLEPGCDRTVTRARRSTICNESDGLSTDKIWGNMFRVEAETDVVTLRTTTAYRSWKNKILGSDLDGLGSLRGALFNIGPTNTLNGFPAAILSGNPLTGSGLGLAPGTAAFLSSQAIPQITQSLFTATNARQQSQWSQEIELVSNGDGPFQWVVGGFFFSESGKERNVQNFGFVLDTNQAVYNSTNFGGLAPLIQANNPARFRVIPQASTLAYSANGTSKAVYGQASYRPGGQDGAFGLTLGLRYSWDTKQVLRTQNGAVPYTLGADKIFNYGRKKFSAPTGHLTLDYRANEDINLYLRAARGYRSGGFNLRQATHNGNAAAPPFGNRTIPLTPFDEETIDAFEIGAKTQFFDRVRLNVAVFHNIYKDQLATIPVPIVGSGSFGTITVNAGKTTYSGIEVEGQVKISDNFSIDGNLGYLNVNVKNFPGADITNTTRNIAGLLNGAGAYAPKYTGAIAANVVVPLSGDAKLTGRLGYNYTSGYQMFANPLTAPFSKTTEGDARGLVDGQLRIEGIKFGGSGDGFGVTLWGKNLTNKKYVTRAVDFGQLGFAGVIYGDPRTYGLTFDVEF